MAGRGGGGGGKVPRMPRMVKNHLLSPEASKKETKRNPGKSDLKLSTLNHG